MSQTSSAGLAFSALRSRSGALGGGDLERFFRSAAFFGGHGDGFSAAAAARYSRGTLSAAAGGAARGGGGAAGGGAAAPKKLKVAVIGSGLAGLTTAHELVSSGRAEVAALERPP